MENNEKLRSVGKWRRESIPHNRLKRVLRLFRVNEAEINGMAYKMLEGTKYGLSETHWVFRMVEGSMYDLNHSHNWN